ncbi:D-amino-acid transaminase [Kurthia massiliensis]|uniref:D-amino-acid transaminase n=1 Tax=Kurthia massiliensis TaxID=1033739 RepID=UPI000288AA83|nr:D-amino-acid transaminase [Kurthia massiliensis]
MTHIWVNNRLMNRNEATIDPEDRGYQFGDGVYEVVKVYDGNLFEMTAHIDRFYRSADELRIVIPYTKDVLHKMVYDLVEADQLETGHVYMQITRGVAERQHYFPENATAVFTAYTQVSERPIEQFENGISALLYEDIRWLRCDIKSLNLLGAVLAKQAAHEANCDEAILHRGNIVTEGSSSNVYGIKDGKVYTHPANNLILNGITRQVVLRCAEEEGIEVIEEAMTVEALLAMDEVFFTSTGAEVSPIVKINDTVIQNGKPGPWTRKLQQAFNAKVQQSITI